MEDFFSFFSRLPIAVALLPPFFIRRFLSALFTVLIVKYYGFFLGAVLEVRSPLLACRRFAPFFFIFFASSASGVGFRLPAFSPWSGTSVFLFAPFLIEFFFLPILIFDFGPPARATSSVFAYDSMHERTCFSSSWYTIFPRCTFRSDRPFESFSSLSFYRPSLGPSPPGDTPSLLTQREYGAGPPRSSGTFFSSYGSSID